LPVQAIEIVGFLVPDLQMVTVFSAGVATGTDHRQPTDGCAI
jgi:hypothetical protein